MLSEYCWAITCWTELICKYKQLKIFMQVPTVTLSCAYGHRMPLPIACAVRTVCNTSSYCYTRFVGLNVQSCSTLL